MPYIHGQRHIKLIQLDIQLTSPLPKLQLQFLPTRALAMANDTIGVHPLLYPPPTHSSIRALECNLFNKLQARNPHNLRSGASEDWPNNPPNITSKRPHLLGPMHPTCSHTILLASTSTHSYHLYHDNTITTSDYTHPQLHPG